MNTTVYAVVYRNDLLDCQSVSFVSTDKAVAEQYGHDHEDSYDEWKVISIPAVLTV